MSDRPTLETTEGAPAILEALARACWAKAHDGADCPEHRVPSLETLVTWLAEAPNATWGEVAAAEIARGADAVTWLSSIRDWLQGDPSTPEAVAPLVVDGLIGRAHSQWLALAQPRPRHPAAPLIDGWQRLAPAEVAPETRADRRIMPMLRVAGPTPERERGMLFGGLVEDRPRSVELSLFPELEPDRPRVPLLEIVDRTGLPIRSKGRGAPLEARLLVRGGLLMIRRQDRRLQTIRIAVKVRELLDGLWPPRLNKRGNVARDAAKNWPKLLDALYRARDWTVPDAAGGRWFPMALRRLPAGAQGMPSLDDLVVLDLAPVPGAVSGADVNLPWLDRMGVSSGPKWRAYIAARSLIWLPGTTRRPVPHTRGKRYGWSHNPDDYPVLTLHDLRRLAFGDRDDKHRTRTELLAPWRDLPDVTVEEAADPRTGIRGWRLQPTRDRAG